MITTQYARIAHHRVTTTGDEPTVPTSNDFTDGSWLTTDIAKGEMMFNMTDDRAWFRSDNGIIELATMTGNNSIWTLDADNNVVNNKTTGSPLVSTSVINGLNNTIDNTDCSNNIFNIANTTTTNTSVINRSILTGDDHNITGYLQNSLVIGFQNGTYSSTTNSIIAGRISDISGDNSLVIGNTNYLAGDNSIICGYYNGTTSGSNYIICGESNTSTAALNNSIICGDGNSVSNTYNSIIAGSASTISYIYNSVILGDTINVNNYYNNSLIGGNIKGETTLFGISTLVNETSGAVTALGYIDGTNAGFKVNTGKSVYAKISVIGKDQSNGDSIEYHGECLIKNVSGTTSLVGSPALTSTYGDAGLATSAVTLIANNTDDRLDIQFTGIAAKDITWSARIDWVIV